MKKVLDCITEKINKKVRFQKLIGTNDFNLYFHILTLILAHLLKIGLGLFPEKWSEINFKDIKWISEMRGYPVQDRSSTNPP